MWNYRQNIIELDPDADDGDFYGLTPDPLKRNHHKSLNPLKLRQQ